MDNLREEVVNRLCLSTLFVEESLNDDQSLRGLNGLRNMGNTCYMNAALQTLSNCPPLREYFCSLMLNSNLLIETVAKRSDSLLSDSLNNGQSMQPLANAFRDVMLRLWSDSETSIITPTFFLFKLRDKCSQFQGFNQQDAQEFIRCFLDALHQELRRPIQKWESDLLSKNDSSDLIDQPSSFSACNNEQMLSTVSSLHITENENEEKLEAGDSGLSSDTEDIPKSQVIKSNNQNAGKESPFKSEINDNDKIVEYKSIITEVFDGQLVSSVKCQVCQHISYTKENFQDISLSISSVEQLDHLQESPSTGSFTSQKSTTVIQETEQNLDTNYSVNTNESRTVNNAQYSYIYWIYSITSRWLFRPWYQWLTFFYRYMFAGSILLENCLKAFFSTDFLHGDDMYSCEKCAKLRNGAKQCEIIRLPEILCIHLKRFRHDNMYNSKVNTKVTFPLCDLDMRPFVKKSVLEKNENMITEYDLVAIISHRGCGIEYGHYVAYCRNDSDKNWYEFDDAVVTRVNALEVMNREAYVLFYQKKTSDSLEDVRTQCLKLLRCSIKGLNLETIDLDRYYISKEWFHKFLTFSEPGQINNCDFLCAHGKLTPKLQINNDQFFIPCVYLTKTVWEFLQKKMGGGPECSELRECDPCRRSFNRMLERKHYERKTYLELGKNSVYADFLPPNLISDTWLEKWKAFIFQTNAEPPPPINNHALVSKFKDGVKIRIGSNYSKINRETWNFFYETYGGGPELFALVHIQPNAEEVAHLIAKIDAHLKLQAEKTAVESNVIGHDSCPILIQKTTKEEENKFEEDFASDQINLTECQNNSDLDNEAETPSTPKPMTNGETYNNVNEEAQIDENLIIPENNDEQQPSLKRRKSSRFSKKSPSNTNNFSVVSNT